MAAHVVDAHESGADANAPGGLAPPHRFPSVEGYEIRQQLGETPAGDVYLAAHTASGALRTLAVQRAESDPAAVRRIVREVLEASRVKHPSVALVDGVGTTRDGRLYVATAYVAGTTLAELLAAEGHLPARRAVQIALRAAEALDAAHKQNVMHGDLTPEQIIVGPAGSDGVEPVTVTGFGMTAARTGSATPLPPSKSARPYASPERINGGAPDARSDVFSLASLLLHALSGNAPPPPRASTGRGTTPTFSAAIQPGQPAPRPAPAQVLLIARAAEPERRYPSAAIFRDTLALAFGEGGEEARRPSDVTGSIPVVGPPRATPAASTPLRAPTPRTVVAPVAAPVAAPTPAPAPALVVLPTPAIMPTPEGVAAVTPIAPAPSAPAPSAPAPSAPAPSAPAPSAPAPSAPAPAIVRPVVELLPMQRPTPVLAAPAMPAPGEPMSDRSVDWPVDEARVAEPRAGVPPGPVSGPAPITPRPASDERPSFERLSYERPSYDEPATFEETVALEEDASYAFPPTPIGSPAVASLDATLTPVADRRPGSPIVRLLQGRRAMMIGGAVAASAIVAIVTAMSSGSTPASVAAGAPTAVAVTPSTTAGSEAASPATGVATPAAGVPEAALSPVAASPAIPLAVTSAAAAKGEQPTAAESAVSEAPSIPKVVLPDAAMRSEVSPSDTRLSLGALDEVTGSGKGESVDGAQRQPETLMLDAGTRAQINATLGRFARALESRDIGALRQVYPGISSAERTQWLEFFRSAESVRANFTAQEFQAAEGGVDVAAVGRLRFYKRDTREQMVNAVNLNVLMTQGPGGWRMKKIH